MLSEVELLEIDILKKEHETIKDTLKAISKSQINSDKVMDSLGQSLTYQNEILNKHFEDDKEFRTQNKELISEVKLITAAVSSIKLELANVNLQNHELIDGKLNNVYKRVRDLESDASTSAVTAETSKAAVKKEVKTEILDIIKWMYGIVGSMLGLSLFLFWFMFASMSADVEALKNGTHSATKDRITKQQVIDMMDSRSIHRYIKDKKQ